MKKILSIVILPIVLFCGFSAALSAQAGSVLTLDEGSFRLEQTNALGGVNIDPIGKDRSNRACFRLKLRLDRMTPEDIRQVEVKVLGGNVVLMKREVASGGNGLILEMTAKPETRFYIKHPSLGESNTVTISPEADKVYLMDGWADQKLTVVVSCAKAGADVWLDGVYRGKTGESMALNIQNVMAGSHTVKIQSGEDSAEKQIEVSPANVLFNIELKSAAHLQQFVVFNVTPADALVELNGEMLFVADGMAQKLVRFGTYTYKVIAKDYHPAEGRITVDDINQKKVVNVSLKQAFGWIDISGSSVDGAIVYIDDKMVGKAPLKSDKVASGVHNVKIVKQMYRNYESSVTVTDGAVAELRPVLAADFETVTLTTDADSEIWINEQQRGTGSWTGDLGTGSYIVECRKPNHRTTSETITVSPGMSVTKISLKSPQPIYGVLSIMSAPGNAEAWLDGKNIGLTPIYLPQILIGSHTLKLTKSGCADWTGNVNVAEGQIAEINATLQSGASVTFTSNVSGAQLYLDGVLLGPANGTYDVAFGSHTIVCKASGKKDLTKNITISQTDINRTVDCRFGATRETIKVKGVSFNMIKVEGGTFTMGATPEQGSDAESDEMPAHKVTLSDYYIGQGEVTEALWQAVMGSKPCNMGNEYPVANVSWDDCQDFIRKLNSLTGRTFRLPTEAEWEFAARGGNESKGYMYPGSNIIDNVAWYMYSESKMPKSPNELGLYDMAGNVSEWCQDWYGPYSSSAQTNPTGPSTGSRRVLRGGSFHSDAPTCRVSARGGNGPDSRVNSFGLRLVLVP